MANINKEVLLPTNDILKICAEQNCLLKEQDELIEWLTKQLSEYEKELYYKDIYIEKLENKLRQIWNTTNYREKVLW